MAAQPAAYLNRKNVFVVSSSLILLLTTAFFLWWMFERADREMRENLLLRANIAAQSLNPEFLKKLTGNKADEALPEYHRLRDQLAALHNARGNIRFAYILGIKKNDAVFFFVDGDQGDPVAPGEEYEDASEELRGTFRDKRAFVEGPLPDQWGVWVSALVPLVDHETGEVFAVFGVDSEAGMWYRDLALRTAPSAIPGLLLMAGIALSLFSIGRQNQFAKPALRRLIIPLTAVFLLIITGAVALILLQQKDYLNQSSQLILANASDTLSRSCAQEGRFLSVLGETLAQGRALRDGLNNGTPEAMLAIYLPVFARLKAESRIHRIAILDAQLGYFSSDTPSEPLIGPTDRLFAEEARRTGATVSGLSLWPSGRLMIQVVCPVRERDAVVGYLIMNTAAADVFDDLQRELQVTLVVALRKDRLGADILAREVRGEPANSSRITLGGVVVTDEAFAALPAELARDIQRSEGDLHGLQADAELRRRAWRVLARPLADVFGNDVAEVLIVRNIAAEQSAYGQIAFMVTFFGVLILLGVVGFLYALLRRTDAGIQTQIRLIEESEERHRVLFSYAPDAYFILSEKLEIMDCNPAACIMLDGERTQIVHRHVMTFSPEFQPDGRRSTEALTSITQHTRLNGTCSFFWQHKNLNGTVFSCEVVLSPVTISGAPHFFASLRDVTDRLRAEREMKTYVSLLNAALESTADGILVVDRAGCIVRWNRKFQELWGIPDALLASSEDEPVLRHVTQQVVDSEHFLKRVRELYQCPEECSLDEIHLTGGRTLERYSQPQRDGVKTIGRVWSFRDITARKIAEQELLLSERLSATGVLAAGVAHNFNNLNTGILGHLEILQRKEVFSEGGSKKLALVIETIKRSVGLTDNLLAFAGKRQDKPGELELASLVADAVALVHNEFESDGITISTQLADHLTVFGNAGELGHVLINLLINARHALMDAAQKTLTIRCAQEGGSAMIQIIDTGCGMSEGTLKNIFTPFYTTKGEHAAPGSTQARIRGTGLGLSSSKVIIEKHHGSILVASAVGKGTQVTVLLPVNALRAQ